MKLVCDKISDWDCSFSFSEEEILKWANEPFYLFLLGRRLRKHSSPHYKDDWMNTAYYKKGKIYAEKLKSKKTKIKRSDRRSSVYSRFYKRGLYYPIEKHETNFRNSFIEVNGTRYKVKIPIDFKGSFYRPKPGFNPLWAARKTPYCYSVLGNTYYYGWSRAKNFTDVTAMFMGIGDYPAQLDKLYFDLTLADRINELGAYPFLIHTLLRKRNYITMDDYISFLSMRMSL